MESYQKLLNDGMVTEMEKYSVIKVSGPEVPPSREREESTILLPVEQVLKMTCSSLAE